MSTFLYTRPTDRIRGTLTVQSGTEDPGYLAANLDDDQPDKPAKLTTPTGAWVRNLTVPTRCDVFGIIHHNLAAGVEVRLQGNATNVWTAPSVDILIPVPPPHVDRFSINLWVDLRTAFPVAASRTMQYWRLAVIGTNAAAVAVGEWAMYTIARDLGIRNIKKGSERWWRRPTIIHETDFLVRRMYPMATVVRAVTVDIDPTDEILAEVEAWQRSSIGPSLPFLIVPHIDQDEAWFVVFMGTDQSYTRTYMDYNPAQLMMQEMSRGLYL